MKILMLVNWKVERCKVQPKEKQPADYVVEREPYWFYKYFSSNVSVDVMDVSHIQWIEDFERKKIHVHVTQGIRAISKLDEYDLIVSHGMTSAVIIALWRRIFKTKAKHIVFDIGCFNSAAKGGLVMKLMQFASKSIDYIIYHTYCQKMYYKTYYPWLENKCKFIKFGVDNVFINAIPAVDAHFSFRYILCIGAGQFRDRDTLIKAYSDIETDVKLMFLGEVFEKYKGINNVVQIGKVSFKEMIKYIDNSELCVLPLPYHEYSYGQMTLIDQMARGKCVLTSRVPSFENYVKDGKDVIFYEVKNVEDCKKKLLMLLNDPVKRRMIGNNARQSVDCSLNECCMAKSIESVLISISSLCGEDD